MLEIIIIYQEVEEQALQYHQFFEIPVAIVD